jgi:acyl-CoA thioester hydrolase
MSELTNLSVELNLEVKFSEVDALQIVWHGHYIRYFEDARELFGKKFDLAYMDVYDKGFSIPIVQLNCNYKSALRYGDQAVVKCTYVKSLGAKIIFDYSIKRLGTDVLVADGRTVQVFVSKEGNLQLCSPEFYESWKQKMNMF